jgi:manganese transport protein
LGGEAARIFFAIGLIAAGLTSAITAPLAAAYATVGAMGWKQNLRSKRFRAVWMTVLVIGTVLAASSGRSPTQTILVAQVANGMLLPLIALFLLVAVNRRELMGAHANRIVANALGVVVLLVATGLAANVFYKLIAN